MENPYEISSADHRIASLNQADKKNLIFIRLAVIFSGIIVALKITALVFMLSKNLDLKEMAFLAETALGAGLTIGVLLKSRICAIALFVSTAGMQIYRVTESFPQSNVYLAFAIIIICIFIAPIFLGILGTIAYHKRKKNLAADLLA